MGVTTELVIARHGEAVCNVAGTVGGERGCTGLTPHGRWQARRLAVRLKAAHSARPFDCLYASPRLRVLQTADMIADELGMTPVVKPDLRGPDAGDGDGWSWNDIRTAFGGTPRHDPDRPFAPGAESWNQYLDRVTGTLARIVDDCRVEQRILVVGHQETIEAAHALLLGLPAGAGTRFAFAVDNAGISRWQHHITGVHGVWLLTAHNDTAHLLPDRCDRSTKDLADKAGGGPSDLGAAAEERFERVGHRPDAGTELP